MINQSDMNRDQGLLEKFIRDNYSTAVGMQLEIKKDEIMIQRIKDQSLEPELVRSWMRDYGLFQGISGEIRESIAQSFCDFTYTREHKSLVLGDDFAEVYDLLFNKSSRKWLSASSKLLWCLYPHEVVIYDSFVERVILVLQHLEPSLANVNFEKAPGHKEGSGAIKDYYLIYAGNVQKLFKAYQPQLEELRRQHNPSYEYDIRIFDKLLWILGSPNSK